MYHYLKDISVGFYCYTFQVFTINSKYSLQISRNILLNKAIAFGISLFYPCLIQFITSYYQLFLVLQNKQFFISHTNIFFTCQFINCDSRLRLPRSLPIKIIGFCLAIVISFNLSKLTLKLIKTILSNRLD